jgi:transcriptional regulator with XRE-family HTH domain
VLAATIRPEIRERPPAPFPVWLAGALRNEGMTMEAASRRLGVSVKTVSRWIAGTTEPRWRDLSRMREIFGALPF